MARFDDFWDVDVGDVSMADSQVRREGGDGGGSSEVIAIVWHIFDGFEVREWIVYDDAGSFGDNRSGLRNKQCKFSKL